MLTPVKNKKIIHQTIYDKLLRNLMESQQMENQFVYVESPQIQLTEVSMDKIKQKLIDPTTGEQYKGIILEGCFADLAPNPNNNNRIYDIPKYLELLALLKEQIHSQKGVYGELEHPKGYSVNMNRASHKLLDVWYDEKEQKVYGRIIILNTEKGLIAQEIIKSGGSLAISARAAGSEETMSDGTLKAVTKLLTTFDIVYHPGFNLAVLNFVELNESQKFQQNLANNKQGFSGRLYLKDLESIDVEFKEFINLNESINNVKKCFLENLFESKQQSQEKKDQEKLEDNETSDEDEIQKKLEKATDKDLSESDNNTQNKTRNNFFKQMFNAQKMLKKVQFDKAQENEAKSYYDNSAGFIKTTDSVAISESN